MNEDLTMENKYKVGDKLYFGYFTGDDIVVEEHEVVNVCDDKIELLNTTTNSLSGVHFSWLKDAKLFDTHEEAYNYAIERVRVKFSRMLEDAEKTVFEVKDKIKKFEEKYGKKNG